MKGIRKRTTNEKTDDLYGLILILFFIIICLLIRPSNGVWVMLPLFLVAISNVPASFRMRKIIKEVPVLLDILGISIDELREATNISKYDLTAWEKYKMILGSAEVYDIEDYLLKEYFLRFHKEFVWKDYLKAQQTTEEIEKR